VRGVPVPIGGRAFEIIEVLVQAAGELVTKNDLMKRVWPGAIVEENTLWVHVSAVRKALGPDRGMLKTVAGRGYRLIGTWRSSRAPSQTGEVALAILPPSPPVLLNNLPAASTNLIGRAQAVQELLDLLSAYRVITLTGPGGIGKTKLAVETARKMLAPGHSDVWLVELASLLEPDLLPYAVASALGLRIEVADRTAEVVARAIGDRKILLLLDNCEHIVDAAARYAETMIRLCPYATILATSREVLRIDGEHVYRVPPLDVPDERVTPDDILGQAPFNCLSRGRRRHNRRSCRTKKTCRTSQAFANAWMEFRLPSSLRQHALPRLACLQVNSHLHDRFNLLTAGRRTTLARHQTLRAALDWSCRPSHSFRTVPAQAVVDFSSGLHVGGGNGGARQCRS
jgi:DNA-binding winged helix-turn-helix (wHTH) protein